MERLNGGLLILAVALAACGAPPGSGPPSRPGPETPRPMVAPSARPASPRAPGDADPELAVAALLAAAGRDPTAPGIAAALLALEDPRAREFLDEHRTELIPGLIEALVSGDEAVRADAAGELMDAGPDLAEHAGTLIAAATGSAEPGVRSWAAVLLARVRPEAAEILPWLAEALVRGDTGTAAPCAAAELGGTAAALVPALLEVLSKTLDGERFDGEQECCLEALRAAGPPAGDVVPALLDILARGTEREDAAEILAGYGAAAGAAVPLLIDSLEQANLADEINSWIPRTLGRFGAAAAAAVPGLLDAALASDASLIVRSSAVYALGEIGAAAVPVLVHLLGDGRLADTHWGVDCALDALGRVGPPAGDAVPAVEAMLGLPGRRPLVTLTLARIEPWSSRRLADLAGVFAGEGGIEAYWWFDTTDVALLPALEAGLRNPDAEIRFCCAEQYGGTADEPGPAVAAVVAMLAEGEPERRVEAARLLGEWGVQTARACEALRLVLARERGNEDEDLAERAVEVLGRIGPAAAPAVADLLECLEWGGGNLWRKAIETLGAIGPLADQAVPTLERIAADPEMGCFARWAEEALRRILPPAPR